jgi:methanogenic corrinoid protein MtbC1
LCSEKEVMRLRWVKARVDEGMQTGQAIRALQHLEQEGRFPDFTLLAHGGSAYSPTVDPSLETFQKRLTQVLLAHDLQQADRLLAEILTVFPIENLILDVMSPTLNEIGIAWHDGQITVATEHLTTNFLRQHLLMWMMTGPLPYAGVAPILLACAPEEWHEGSLLMMGVLLRRQRWPVAYLGQAVPLEDLANLSRKMKSPAIIFVAMTEKSAQGLLEWPHYFPEAAQQGRPIVGYGGLIFNEDPARREKMPGLFLGETLRQGIETLTNVLRAHLPPQSL